MNYRLWLTIGLIAIVVSVPIASAAGTSLSIATNPLGKIVVNSKGLTAYFYDLDKANSGVSVCTGGCATNWPAIISTSKTPRLAGIKGKVTVLPGTKQIAINGRPIYTFIGDSTRGSTNGQGVGGVWYVISPSGVELKPVASAKPSFSPTPTISPTPI